MELQVSQEVDMFDLTPETPVVTQVDVTQQCFHLDMTLGMYGQTRKSGGIEVITDAKKDHVLTSKFLFKSKKYREIVSAFSEIRRHMDRYCLPSQKRGFRLVPKSILSSFDEELKILMEQAQDRINEFAAQWPGVVAQAKIDLGELFDANQYPSADAILTYFQVDREYLNFNTTGLEETSAELYLEHEKRAVEKAEAGARQVENALCSAFGELVESLVHHLTPSAEGGSKAFHGSRITQLVDFLDLFKHRNLTGNENLDALVVRSQKLLDGLAPVDIKNSTTLTSHLKTQFKEIESQLGKFVSGANRLYSWEGE
jgi:hypothetical protein